MKTGNTPLPFAEGEFTLQKYPGKGGWTYLSLPKPPGFRAGLFGATYVSGCSDDLEFEKLSVWASKNQSLFFPVKASIRKTIGKHQGDIVRVRLFRLDNSDELPAELQLLFEEDPLAEKRFYSLSKFKQNAYTLKLAQCNDPLQTTDLLSKLLRDLDGL